MCAQVLLPRINMSERCVLCYECARRVCVFLGKRTTNNSTSHRRVAERLLRTAASSPSHVKMMSKYPKSYMSSEALHVNSLCLLCLTITPFSSCPNDFQSNTATDHPSSASLCKTVDVHYHGLQHRLRIMTCTVYETRIGSATSAPGSSAI